MSISVPLVVRHEGTIDEWMLVEFQGAFKTTGTMAGKRIGTLVFEDDVPVFKMPHFKLRGREDVLDTPLLVLHAEDMNGKLVAAAVVRKRIIFSETGSYTLSE